MLIPHFNQKLNMTACTFSHFTCLMLYTTEQSNSNKFIYMQILYLKNDKLL